MTAKPRLRLIDGIAVPTDKKSLARIKFGRAFAHEPGANFLRHPEPVLSRWARGADYMNLNPHMERPAQLGCHFRTRT